MTTLRNVWKERVKRPGKRWLSLSASPGPLPTCTKRGNVDLSKGALIQETMDGSSQAYVRFRRSHQYYGSAALVGLSGYCSALMADTQLHCQQTYGRIRRHAGPGRRNSYGATAAHFRLRRPVPPPLRLRTRRHQLCCVPCTSQETPCRRTGRHPARQGDRRPELAPV